MAVYSTVAFDFLNEPTAMRRKKLTTCLAKCDYTKQEHDKRNAVISTVPAL